MGPPQAHAKSLGAALFIGSGRSEWVNIKIKKKR